MRLSYYSLVSGRKKGNWYWLCLLCSRQSPRYFAYSSISENLIFNEVLESGLVWFTNLSMDHRYSQNYSRGLWFFKANMLSATPSCFISFWEWRLYCAHIKSCTYHSQAILWFSWAVLNIVLTRGTLVPCHLGNQKDNLLNCILAAPKLILIFFLSFNQRMILAPEKIWYNNKSKW